VPYPPHRPKPRGVRSRIVRAGAVCGLALVPVAFAGCNYIAGPSSAVRNTYFGWPTDCGSRDEIVPGCTKTLYLERLRIADDDGGLHDLDTAQIFAKKRGANGATVSMGESDSYTPSSDGLNYILKAWPDDIDVTAPIRERLVSQPSGFWKDTWTLDVELPKRERNDAPSPPPAPTVQLFSHDNPMAIAAIAPGPVAPTVLDARDSWGQGTLEYSWDTNGDGIFGDQAKGDWVGVPDPVAGTAYVPLQAARDAFPLSLPVGVKVTTSSGASATTTLTLPVTNQGAGSLSAAPSTGRIAITPLIGTLSDGYIGEFGVTYACVGTGIDTGFETTQPISLEPGGGGTFSAYRAASWTGTNRVRVTFFKGDSAQGTCNNPAPLAVIQSTHTERVTVTNGVVTIASATGAGAHEMAAARAPKGYSGRARVRLNSGAIVAVGKADGASMSGVINQGKYSLTAPARAGRTARPAALALFAKGDFASSSNAVLGFSETNATTPLTGTSTVLLRGAKGALGCMSVVRTDTTTTWSFLGGTRAASKLRMTLTGGPTLNSTINQAAAPQAVRAKAKGAKGRKAASALRPVATNYAITASAKGASRALPAACRALKSRLPSRVG